MKNAVPCRQLKICVLRYNPQERERAPHMQTFEIEEAEGMTLFRRSDGDHYEMIGDNNGVFGCMSLLGCHDVCPKDLPLSTQIAFLRRKMATMGWK